MARNNDWKAIGLICLSNGPHSFVFPYFNSNVLIASCLAKWDEAKLFPYCFLKFSAMRLYRDIKLFPISVKIFLKLESTLFNKESEGLRCNDETSSPSRKSASPMYKAKGFHFVLRCKCLQPVSFFRIHSACHFIPAFIIWANKCGKQFLHPVCFLLQLCPCVLL